jgi:hypothetical protein
MTSPPRRRDDRHDDPVRRILVALNAISDSRAAIERAAALATAFEAELTGLFIEDVNLLHMADLPGYEVILATGRVQKTDRNMIEQQLRSRAEQARTTMARIATAQRLTWSFEVRRGRLGEALLEAAKLADVVAAEWSGPGMALTAATNGHRPVLAYYEGGACGARVLGVAVRAAVARHVPLVILVPARTMAAAEKPFAELRDMLRHHDVEWRMERIAPGVPALGKRLRQSPGQMLMIDTGGKLVAGGNLPGAMMAAGCEVVLVSPLTPQADASNRST